MPMPDFVGWNQEQQASQLRASEVGNNLTNMMMRQQQMQQSQEMQPVTMDLRRAQAEQARAQVEQSRAATQKQKLIQDLISKLGTNPDPNMLRQLGNQLQYAPFITEADRLEALQQSKLGIRSMAGAPAQPAMTQEGPTEAPGQMGPGAPVTTPGQPAQPGILDSLYGSPYVGKEAKALAFLGQSGAPGLKATDYANFVKNLQDKHIAETGKAQARTENAQNKVDFKIQFPSQAGDKTPMGYEPDPAGGLRPIKGGPADYKRQQDQAKVADAENHVGKVSSDIDSLTEMLKANPDIAGGRGMLKRVYESASGMIDPMQGPSDAHLFESKITDLKLSLQRMKYDKRFSKALDARIDKIVKGTGLGENAAIAISALNEIKSGLQNQGPTAQSAGGPVKRGSYTFPSQRALDDYLKAGGK